MRKSRAGFRRRFIALTCTLLLAITLSAAPSAAQEYSLFDRFSLGLGGAILGFNTEVRLDSRELGIGTTLNFEDDLGLDSSKVVPSLGFRARVGKRHLFDGAWTKADRDSTAQALTDIQFGDIMIPVGSAVFLSYEQESISAGYSYYFLLRNRWALGIRGGLRWLSLRTFLEATDTEVELSDEGDASAPLPFVGFSFRFGITPKLRLISDFGWLSIKVGDYDGNQIVWPTTIEYLVAKNFSFGLVAGIADVDVTVDDGEDFIGTVDLGATQLSLFVKGRW